MPLCTKEPLLGLSLLQARISEVHDLPLADRTVSAANSKKPSFAGCLLSATVVAVQSHQTALPDSLLVDWIAQDSSQTAPFLATVPKAQPEALLKRAWRHQEPVVIATKARCWMLGQDVVEGW